MEITKQPEESKVYKKDLSEYGQILAVEISPFVLSQDIILIGFETKILLGHLKIDEQLEFDILADFKHESRCTSLTISPETSISILPNNIIFTAAGSDYRLRVFKSDLRRDNACKVLNGHTSYINDTKFDPDNNFLVSVSDDNTAKLWETEDFKCVATLQLTSPGVSTCWHREDNSKLLLPLGTLRFTTDCFIAVGGIAHLGFVKTMVRKLIVWECVLITSFCSVPIKNNLIFTEAGGHIRFSPFGELVAAVNGLDGTLKVMHVQNNQMKLSVPVTLPSNVSWHCRCPIVCIGDYMTLMFWKVISK
ncbi:nucleoporin Nup37 [Asbolus verrucosus]|uniref:Nucleoporin Nup37 n=1 Tax=Asbolus verrucosus TaxID=1661398 RepID=A0A482W8C0_ASBVE|nr:nucleoporin Nup37 [Asbolus verrucosus]